MTLLEWHDSPVPLKLTVARAALCPTLGVLKSWGSPADKAQLSARADLQLLPCRLSLDLMCKEAVLGGRLSATLPAGRLEYRRRFHLPNGMVLALGVGAQYEGSCCSCSSSSSSGGSSSSGSRGGGMGSACGSSSGSSSGGSARRRHRFKPFLGCQLQFSAGGAEEGDNDEVVVSEQGISDKHRFKLPDRCGGLSLPPMDCEVASTLSLPSGLPGLPSSAGLASLGSTASLQRLQSGLASGGSLPGTPSLPGSMLSSGSQPASPFASLPSLPPTPGSLPSLRLPSLEGSGSGLQAAAAAGEVQRQEQQQGHHHQQQQREQQQQQTLQQLDDRRALQFHIERLALVVRL